MTRFLALTLLFLSTSPVFAQISKEDQQRCETILLNAVNTNKQPTWYTIGLCEYLPVGRVRDHLEAALKSNDPSVRLAAADICLAKAPTQFREAVQYSMDEMQARFEHNRAISQPEYGSTIQGDKKLNRKKKNKARVKMQLPSQQDMIHRAAILMKLGDAKAKKRIETWATQDMSAIKAAKWICPMMCTDPSNTNGKCPICGMNRKKIQPKFTMDDWQAKVEAIRVYQQSGKQVAFLARSIVISEASPYIRLLAADIWSKEAPMDARPHVAIFLYGENRELALELLSVSMPDRFVKEFEAVVNSSAASMSLRFCAYDALLRSGQSKYMSDIRKMIDDDGSKSQNNSDKELALLLMTTHAEAEDSTRLHRLLDSEYKVLAAKALLFIGKKKERK